MRADDAYIASNVTEKLDYRCRITLAVIAANEQLRVLDSVERIEHYNSSVEDERTPPTRSGYNGDI